ncbi:DNA polymerase IV [Alkalicella caledoniensis]|uniref:DNA polymerase IV n=1 Tax=Alkalicella caledoniensis TaxID=2731377 RepID=A0A7G9WCI3_ALKCA|nr:DNA polymerase IV [Alkalicella caledoniensis]QNO16395.1 DNA polymerase IV [Alkalicella caledoniensis]
MAEKVIFHIDVNSAYLSWEAVYALQQGASVDLRDIPAVIGGNEKKRNGIVLAKSIPAKKYNIKTGETLFSARLKCPQLVVAPPRYNLYMQCSEAMGNLLSKYSPLIQFFSIDELFLDYTNMDKHFGTPLQAAEKIREEIKNTLGFTVNIGIGSNKLLAKMASEFEKPDKVHTLFPEEIPKKMWPLAVGELFMVGSKTAEKLQSKNIHSIGELAQTDPQFLYGFLKSHGLLVWNYANGKEDSPVRNEGVLMKGLGNSTTISFDLLDLEDSFKVLLALTETVCTRLRRSELHATVISVSLKNSSFVSYSHQGTLPHATNCTKIVFEKAKELFVKAWKGEPIRHMGIHLTKLIESDFHQLSLFEPDPFPYKTLDKAVDDIRLRYGNTSIVRSSFLHSGFSPQQGGVIREDDYPMMSSIL